MPRRHGWLQDYHQELDHGPERSVSVSGSGGGQSPSPVTINININLGDLISQLVKGNKSAKEALEEMVQETKERKRQRLLERDEDR